MHEAHWKEPGQGGAPRVGVGVGVGVAAVSGGAAEGVRELVNERVACKPHTVRSSERRPTQHTSICADAGFLCGRA